jgi:hypothetical protein
MGFVEVSVNRGNASVAAQAAKGAEVQVTFSQPLAGTPE